MNFPIFISVTCPTSNERVSGRRTINANFITELYEIDIKGEKMTVLVMNSSYTLKVKEAPCEIVRMINDSIMAKTSLIEMAKKNI